MFEIRELAPQEDTNYADPVSADSGASQAAAPRSFRLGMPHMGADGLGRGWLLREACHAHWCAIAADLGVAITSFRDRSGARVLPSVVACTVNGDTTQFREDDEAWAYLSEKPRAENGWRSQLEVHNARGNAVRAEIATAFARRSGPSNQDLEPADLAPEFRADRAHAEMRRTSIIRRLGNSMRARAEADLDPPHYNVTINPLRHINGVGLTYFAAIHDIFEAAEHNAIPDLMTAWPMRDRRMHFFGNLDAGDCLELTSRASAQSLAPTGSVVVQTHAKRRSDGAVIAASESVYAMN